MRAQRSTLTAGLALAGALLLCGMLAMPGRGAVRADEGASETPVEAAPTEAPTEPVSEPPASETPLLVETSPTEAAVTDTPTPFVLTETPGDTVTLEGASATPTAASDETATGQATPTATEHSPTLEASATLTLEAESPSPMLTLESTPTETPTPTATLALTPTSTLTATATLTATLRPALAAFAGAVVINEVVTDPQSDWSGGGFASPPGAGTVSETDAFVELYITASGLNLAGWTLTLDDGTPFSGDLTSSGAFNIARYVGAGSPAYTEAGDYLVLGSPSGSISNSVLVVLRDDQGAVIDQVQVGAGGAPEGGATGPADESICRVPNALDTDDDAGDFTQQAATPGYANVLGPVPPTATAIAHPPLAVLINEVAWAGTAANSADEWLELRNPGAAAINLKDWTLTDGGDLALTFPLLVVPPGGYLLLERSDDATVSDIPADLIYSGGLNDGGEALTLRDALGNVVDTANSGGGAWPAGGGAAQASMERVSVIADASGAWQANTGASQVGHDAEGGLLRGTARAANSGPLPPPPPVPPGTTVLLNEFLPRPAAGADEFIELINLTGAPVDLAGWRLDDGPGGSSPYVLPAGTVIGAGALRVFDQATTGLALNDDGDTVRLLHPDSAVADELAYGSAKAGVSWSRLPDGGGWNANGDPSPGQPNRERPGPPEPTAVPIGVLRGWNDGAWVTVAGRVSVPPGVLGTRMIQVQDGSGGVTVYLGRDDWPPLVVGQPIRLVLGYLRHRGGNLQLYVRNAWHVRPGPANEALPLAPWPLRTGVAAGTASGVPGAVNGYAGSLVSLLARVTRVETQAFWLDDGTGPVRVFFPSAAGVARPPVRVGQTWRVTGIIMEVAPFSATNPRYRLQPRFAGDLAQVVGGVDVPYVATAVPVAVTPTPEPTEVAEE